MRCYEMRYNSYHGRLLRTVLWPSTGAYVTIVYILIPCLVSFPYLCRDGHFSDLIKKFLADNLLPCGLGRC